MFPSLNIRPHHGPIARDDTMTGCSGNKQGPNPHW
jgi:hypothetical protein